MLKPHIIDKEKKRKKVIETLIPATIEKGPDTDEEVTVRKDKEITVRKDKKKKREPIIIEL